MDCREGKYDEENDVLSWKAHKGGNQWFVVNSDNSLSPTHAPKMRWGINKENIMGLVKETDTDRILIFNDVTPTVDPMIPTLPLIMSSPLDGKAIVHMEEGKCQRQHGHGMEQFLLIGDADKARKVFFDEADFVRDSQYTFQAFDAYEHESRPIEFFTKHNDYHHQQFYLTEEGSIHMKIRLDWYLGLNKEHTKAIFVKKDDPNKCIFRGAKEYAATNKRVLET